MNKDEQLEMLACCPCQWLNMFLATRLTQNKCKTGFTDKRQFKKFIMLF